MVTIKFNFELEKVVSYFETRTASEIYHELYLSTHSLKKIFATCIPMEIGDYILMALTQLSKMRDEELSKEIESNRSSDNDISLPLNLKNVGAPPYETITQRIESVLGETATPYLEEHKLLGEYVRTLDVILMSIYGNVTQNAPPEIRELLHQDKYCIDNDSYKMFREWLEGEEKKDIERHIGKSIPERLKPILLPRLYERIQKLASFYNSGKEATLDESLIPDGENPQPGRMRQFLFSYLNSIFGRQDEE